MERPIRVVVFRDGDLYIAQCIEVDIGAQGKSVDEAMKRVRIAINAESREAAANGKDLFDIGPAPSAFHAMFQSDIVDRVELAA